MQGLFQVLFSFCTLVIFSQLVLLTNVHLFVDSFNCIVSVFRVGFSGSSIYQEP